MEFDFSTNTEVSDLSSVPEDFHGLYVEADEGYKLNTEDAGVKGAVSAITKLNATLKTERHKAKNRTNNDITALKDYGETVEEIGEAFKASEAKINELTEQISKGGKFDEKKVRQNITEAVNAEKAKEVEGLNRQVEALTGQLTTTMVDKAAISAISEHKGAEELLMPVIRNQVKTLVEDNEFVVRVVDKAGDVRYSGVTGAPMTIKELVKSLKEDKVYARAFDSETSGGSGVKPGSTSGRSMTSNKGAPMSATQKISAGLNKRK